MSDAEIVEGVKCVLPPLALAQGQEVDGPSQLEPCQSGVTVQ